jgi:hypothetical protein
MHARKAVAAAAIGSRRKTTKRGPHVSERGRLAGPTGRLRPSGGERRRASLGREVCQPKAKAGREMAGGNEKSDFGFDLN